MASIEARELDAIGLKASSLAALHRLNLSTVGELLKLAPSEPALRALHGVGPVAFDDITTRLADLGSPLEKAPAPSEKTPVRRRLHGPTPPELSCYVAALIPTGSATPGQLADGLGVPLAEAMSSLRVLRRQGWVSETRIGGERHFLVPQDAVARYRHWARSVRWRCARHDDHRLG